LSATAVDALGGFEADAGFVEGEAPAGGVVAAGGLFDGLGAGGGGGGFAALGEGDVRGRIDGVAGPFGATENPVAGPGPSGAGACGGGAMAGVGGSASIQLSASASKLRSVLRPQ